MPWLNFEDGAYWNRGKSVLSFFTIEDSIESYCLMYLTEFNPEGSNKRTLDERYERIKGRHQFVRRNLQSNLRKTSIMGQSTMEHRCKQSAGKTLQNNVWSKKEIEKDKKAEMIELSYLDLFYRFPY